MPPGSWVTNLPLR
ncbi:unnamed protein product, partial [Adineta steineri]